MESYTKESGGNMEKLKKLFQATDMTTGAVRYTLD